MIYYIDGMDVNFGSFFEIKDFLLSLPYRMLYQFIDRHVYYGDPVRNVYMCVAVIQISYCPRLDGFRYTVDIVRTSDHGRYRSVSVRDPFLMRYFICE